VKLLAQKIWNNKYKWIFFKSLNIALPGIPVYYATEFKNLKLKEGVEIYDTIYYILFISVQGIPSTNN